MTLTPIIVQEHLEKMYIKFNPHGDCPMSTLSVDTIQGKTTAGTVAMPAGMVVQTVSLASTSGITRLQTSSNSFVATGDK